MTPPDWLSLAGRIWPRLVALAVLASLLLPAHTTASLFWSVARPEARRVTSLMESAFGDVLGHGTHRRRCARSAARKRQRVEMPQCRP